MSTTVGWQPSIHNHYSFSRGKKKIEEPFFVDVEFATFFPPSPLPLLPFPLQLGAIDGCKAELQTVRNEMAACAQRMRDLKAHEVSTISMIAYLHALSALPGVVFISRLELWCGRVPSYLPFLRARFLILLSSPLLSPLFASCFKGTLEEQIVGLEQKHRNILSMDAAHHSETIKKAVIDKEAKMATLQAQVRSSCVKCVYTTPLRYDEGLSLALLDPDLDPFASNLPPPVSTLKEAVGMPPSC